MPKRLSLISCLLFQTLVVPSASAYERVPLTIPSGWEEITFPDIPATTYENAKPDRLVMRVRSSASFLLKSFASVRQVKRVEFVWRSSGTLLVKNPDQERSKAGDDFKLRVGLLLAGKAPLIPFFAPTWIKAIRDHLRFSAGNLLYIVVGALSKPGSQWESPYGSGMKIISAASEVYRGDQFDSRHNSQSDGQIDSQRYSQHYSWNKASLSFPKAQAVVGLWLMADGDNTGSTFTTELRDLQLN